MMNHWIWGLLTENHQLHGLQTGNCISAPGQKACFGEYQGFRETGSRAVWVSVFHSAHLLSKIGCLPFVGDGRDILVQVGVENI